jgi:hypothetical protein
MTDSPMPLAAVDSAFVVQCKRLLKDKEAANLWFGTDRAVGRIS